MIIYPPLIADTIPAFTAAAVKIPFENNPAVAIGQATEGFQLAIKDYNSSKIIGYGKSSQQNLEGVSEIIFQNFDFVDNLINIKNFMQAPKEGVTVTLNRDDSISVKGKYIGDEPVAICYPDSQAIKLEAGVEYSFRGFDSFEGSGVYIQMNSEEKPIDIIYSDTLKNKIFIPKHTGAYRVYLGIYPNKEVNSVIYPGLYKNKLISGNYYKFQMAYNDNSTPFYYSSASIGRCVEKEKEIYITDLKENKLSEQASNPNIYNSFQGIYVSSMQSEPLYSYRFIFKNAITNETIQDTGILLFNNSKGYAGTYKINFDIKKELLKDTVYTLQFFVTTVNGYTTQTPLYKIIAASKAPMTTELKFNVLSQDAEAVENGYVKLTISGTSTSKATVQIQRTSDEETWNVIAEYTAIGGHEVDYTFLDTSVEQGITYKYALIQVTTGVNDSKAYSERKYVTSITPDFENMFLTDGEKQLKIKYDPKVSSFKDTILESKTDTIGGQYPFFFRNGQVRYKEIPISGLVSYWMDRDNFFMNDEELGISEKSTLRNQIKALETFEDIPTTDLVGYNYTAERRFKLAVLEWLTNGKPKLFRSPSEGNYVIRLMSVSMSPRETIGRIVHDFSCTGYECAAADIESLQASRLVRQPEIKEPEITDGDWKIFSKTYNKITWIDNQVEASKLVSLATGQNLVIKNLKWQLIQPTLKETQDYLLIDNIADPFFNPTGIFTIAEDYLMTGFTLHKGNEILNDNASITFEYKIVDTTSANNYVDTFATSVSDGLDVVMSIPINTTVAEAFGKVKPLAIYTLVAQRDINAKDNDNFNLTLEDQIIDLSDGQIRVYNDLPFKIEKGNGIHIDMYIRVARADLQKYSSQLGKFILGYSKLGGII